MSKFYYNLVERKKASSSPSLRFIVGRDILYKKTGEEKEIRNSERSVYSCLTAEWLGVWFPRISRHTFKVHQKYYLSMFIRNGNFFPERDYKLCNAR